ncbi:MAG: hypothetical protein HWN67_20630 [Candidatus Helarchaeota archaeon]|nr:hypothetical protein [Candidatus Helarchaeota archaeon]
MSDSSQNETSKKIRELLQQAEEEKRKYNWDKEIEILKQVEKISLDEKLKEIEAEVYYKLGEINHLVADFEKTQDEALKKFQLAILSFQKACKIFKELKKEEKINASMGFIEFIKYRIEIEEGKKDILLESAKNYFNQAKLIYFKNGNLIDSLKVAIFEIRALGSLIGEKLIRIEEDVNFTELASENVKIITNVWEEINNLQDFPEIYIYYFLCTITEFAGWIGSYLPIEDLNIKQYHIDNLNRCKELIDSFENSTKILNKFNAYLFYSYFSITYAIFYVNNQFEQKKYFKRAEKSLKKGEILLPQINSNALIAIFHFVRFIISIFLAYLGFLSRGFKYILDDLSQSIDLAPLIFPKIIAAQLSLYALGVLGVSADNPAIPDSQRIDITKMFLDLVELAKNKILMLNNPNYKLFILFKNTQLSAGNSILGNLIKDKKESSRYLQSGFEIFNEISKYNYPKYENTFNYYSGYLVIASRTGIRLARNSSEISEKLNYVYKALDLLLKTKKMAVGFWHIENLFLIGNTYYQIGKLTDDNKILNKAHLAYMDAIEYCKNKGYFNLMGTVYVNIAQIEDRLGNFLSAAENYKNAIDSFDQAILTLTYSKLGKKIEKLKNYLQAWNIIERAKSYHTLEDHYKAQINYEQASQILKNLREYKFESPFYFAWAMLEKAEYLSKKNQHQEAAAAYIVSKSNFQDANKILNSYLAKKKSLEDIERISNLIKVAKIREQYCTARHQIETARLESKKGEHLIAAGLYNKAGSLFENICQLFKIKREKQELTAIYYLCKAWKNMEQANYEQKSSIYAIAAELFEKACNNFAESRMKKLSLGNSLYCSALEFGGLFDKSSDLEEKINYYKKIKMFLREASKNYQMGGFEQDAQWALATSTFFDAIWHLILSDNEIDFSKKNQYLNIATKYLNNALHIFDEAGYKQKKDEVVNCLEMINDEKNILTSALNVIEKPAISESAVGISAPSCPIEISSSVNIDEMQKTDLQTESELNWSKRIHHIYFIMPNGVSIYDHSFRVEKDVEPQLVAGGLTGISALIQEVTKSQTKVKIVEQEEMLILLEHGKYTTVALITEENLMTLRNKLKQLIQDIEDFYQEEFETYSGNLSVFSKIGKFVQKIFET